MAHEFLPRRVVCLQPSATVVLRELRLLDRVVACTRYCADVCPELANAGKLIVHDSWTAQADQILAAEPDLVLASVPYQLEAVAQILKAGIRFLGLAPKTLDDIYEDIAAIAGVMGAHDDGRRLICHMRQNILAVRQEASHAATRPRVFCEEWGKPLIASQSWVEELVDAAGGHFLGHPGQHTTADAVRDLAPDVVIAAWCGAGDRVPLEKIVRERGWDQLPAVRERRVYCTLRVGVRRERADHVVLREPADDEDDQADDHHADS